VTQGQFYTYLLDKGWNFFYRLILQVMIIIRPTILISDEMGILEILKFYTGHGTKKAPEGKDYPKIDWKKAMETALDECTYKPSRGSISPKH